MSPTRGCSTATFPAPVILAASAGKQDREFPLGSKVRAGWTTATGVIQIAVRHVGACGSLSVAILALGRDVCCETHFAQYRLVFVILFALIDVRNRLRISMKVVVVVCASWLGELRVRDADNVLGLYKVWWKIRGVAFGTEFTASAWVNLYPTIGESKASFTGRCKVTVHLCKVTMYCYARS